MILEKTFIEMFRENLVASKKNDFTQPKNYFITSEVLNLLLMTIQKTGIKFNYYSTKNLVWVIECESPV